MNTKYFKTCIVCGSQIFYKSKESYWANKKKNENAPCRSCSGKIHSARLKGRTRCAFSDEWRKNISIAHKTSRIWKASMNTPEYKQKHREKMLRLIGENKIKVPFNKKSCDFFNLLNSKLNFDGSHGLNRGEAQISGYFPDFYDPTKNIIIEWDEPYHEKTKIKQNDLTRQNYLFNKLKCQFYRIKEIDNTVYKIDDDLSEDYTQSIQNILHEFQNQKTASCEL